MMGTNNIPHIVDQGSSWAYQGDPTLKPNTITFSNPGTWVMQLTADRKIIVNEDVEVSEAAKVVLEAVQDLLRYQRRPLCKELVDRLVHETNLIDDQPYEFVKAIEKAHGIE